MNWIDADDDRYILRADAAAVPDLAIVWGVEAEYPRGEKRWSWYIVGRGCSEPYATKKEAQDAAVAAWVANRLR
jgi:hypothetical protein